MDFLIKLLEWLKSIATSLPARIIACVVCVLLAVLFFFYGTSLLSSCVSFYPDDTPIEQALPINP